MKKLLSIVLIILLLLIGIAVPATANSAVVPQNLNQLSVTEQLNVFNAAVSRVRADRPGYTASHAVQLHADQMVVEGLAAPQVIHDLFTQTFGQPRSEQTQRRGQANSFMTGMQNPQALRPEDIIAITSVRQGDNWRITVQVRSETNPTAGGPVSRVAPVATATQIQQTIGQNNLTANLSGISQHVHSVFARVTINPQGQVISASTGYASITYIDDMRFTGTVLVPGAVFNATVPQTTLWEFTNFDWAAGSGGASGGGMPMWLRVGLVVVVIAAVVGVIVLLVTRVL